MSRLNYCLEVVSQGRQKDLEKLQRVQSAAARWVLQTRKKDWSLTGGLRKLGWLSMAQQAAYTSIRTAMKVLRDKKPERLYDTLTEKRDGVRARKIVKESKFKGRRLLLTTKKSWSNRSLRWLAQMPPDLISNDITLRSTKTELKRWVKHHIPVRGDKILWGKKLTKEHMRIANETGESEEPEPPESPGVGEGEGEHLAGVEETQEGFNREEIRREDTAGGSLNQGRGGTGRIVLRGLLLLLVMLIRVNVAIVKRQEDRITETKKITSWRRRNSGIWGRYTSIVQRQGGHNVGTGRVKCGEG